MKATFDTNVLLRMIVEDDPKQAALAVAAVSDADTIVLPTIVACELVWLATRRYRFPKTDVAEALLRLVAAAKVKVDEPAMAAGLAMLQAGGDFADGVIAHEGRRLGGETFVSFDRQAVRLAEAQGFASRLLR